MFCSESWVRESVRNYLIMLLIQEQFYLEATWLVTAGLFGLAISSCLLSP